jgi:hypothetical protein
VVISTTISVKSVVAGEVVIWVVDAEVVVVVDVVDVAVVV